VRYEKKEIILLFCPYLCISLIFHYLAKCIAENVGGAAEDEFTIYVAGPGNSPEITQLHTHKPRTIEVLWIPPTIPNGEITRYIIYYTPLDDQVICPFWLIFNTNLGSKQTSRTSAN
jgi:hypothetical protein